MAIGVAEAKAVAGAHRLAIQSRARGGGVSAMHLAKKKRGYLLRGNPYDMDGIADHVGGALLTFGHRGIR